MQAIPDLLHPEQEGMFAAHAYQDNADMAKAARLRPGDRAVMRGTLQQQTIALENGGKTTVNHWVKSNKRQMLLSLKLVLPIFTSSITKASQIKMLCVN